MPTSKLERFQQLGVNYKLEFQRNVEILQTAVNSFKSTYADCKEIGLNSPKFEEKYLIRYRIKEILISVTDDIVRYCLYHDIVREVAEGNDGLKAFALSPPTRAAFFVKWIVNFKPCKLDDYVKNASEACVDRFENANEILAIFVASAILGLQNENGRVCLISTLLTQPELKALIYQLKYRINHQDALYGFFNRLYYSNNASQAKDDNDTNLKLYWTLLLMEAIDGGVQEEIRSKSKVLVSELQILCKSKKIVLVLGAGVSTSCGLPNWIGLINNVFKIWLKRLPEPEKYESLSNDFLSELTSSNPIIMTRFVRQLLEKAPLEKEFKEIVHEGLYNNSSTLFSSSLIQEIVSWCQSGKIECVINYNFDDILEQHLEKQNILHIPVFRKPVKIDNAALAIYHVHGFLPQNADKEKSDAIVFSEEDYHQQYQEFYSWNSQIQVDKYRNHTCLFIGSSLNDPNQRRLLDTSKEYRPQEIKHYIFQRNQVISDKDKIYSNIFQINAEAFGINTIWVEKHDDIPKILKEIRETPPMT